MADATSSGIETIDRVRVRILPDGRMTREDAARYLGHATKTLAMWQLQGKGPRMPGGNWGSIYLTLI